MTTYSERHYSLDASWDDVESLVAGWTIASDYSRRGSAQLGSPQLDATIPFVDTPTTTHEQAAVNGTSLPFRSTLDEFKNRSATLLNSTHLNSTRLNATIFGDSK